MSTIKSAAEIQGDNTRSQSQIWEGIKQTAVSQVNDFCTKNNIDPGKFMSNLGLLDEKQWSKGKDWKDCVNWNSFNQIIFQNVTENKKGLNLYAFNQDLQGRHETYAQNLAAKPAAPAVVEPPKAQVAAAQQQEEAPALQIPKTPKLPPQTSENMFKQVKDALEPYADKLTPEQKQAFYNIVGRTEAGNQLLVTRNLQFYTDGLLKDGKLTQDEADGLLSGLSSVVDGAAKSAIALNWRGTGQPVAIGTPESKAPKPKLAMEQAPAQEERHVYRVTFKDSRGELSGNPKILSTFEVVSPVPIESAAAFSNFIGNPPPGTTITKVAGDRRARIDDSPKEMTTFRNGVQNILHTPGLNFEVAEQPQAKKPSA